MSLRMRLSELCFFSTQVSSSDKALFARALSSLILLQHSSDHNDGSDHPNTRKHARRHGLSVSFRTTPRPKCSKDSGPTYVGRREPSHFRSQRPPTKNNIPNHYIHGLWGLCSLSGRLDHLANSSWTYPRLQHMDNPLCYFPVLRVNGLELRMLRLGIDQEEVRARARTAKTTWHENAQ